MADGSDFNMVHHKPRACPNCLGKKLIQDIDDSTGDFIERKCDWCLGTGIITAQRHRELWELWYGSWKPKEKKNNNGKKKR